MRSKIETAHFSWFGIQSELWVLLIVQFFLEIVQDLLNIVGLFILGWFLRVRGLDQVSPPYLRLDSEINFGGITKQLLLE